RAIELRIFSRVWRVFMVVCLSRPGNGRDALLIVTLSSRNIKAGHTETCGNLHVFQYSISDDALGIYCDPRVRARFDTTVHKRPVVNYGILELPCLQIE